MNNRPLISTFLLFLFSFLTANAQLECDSATTIIPLVISINGDASRNLQPIFYKYRDGIIIDTLNSNYIVGRIEINTKDFNSFNEKSSDSLIIQFTDWFWQKKSYENYTYKVWYLDQFIRNSKQFISCLRFNEKCNRTKHLHGLKKFKYKRGYLVDYHISPLVFGRFYKE